MMLLVMVHRHNPETVIAHFPLPWYEIDVNQWIDKNISTSDQFLHNHYIDVALYSIEPNNQVERRSVYRPFEGWINLDD